MARSTKDLLEERMKIVADARKVSDAAISEKRGMTPEEDSKFAAMMADADRLKADADRDHRGELRVLLGRHAPLLGDRRLPPTSPEHTS